MHIAAAPQITLIIAAALGLLNVWLGLRIIRVRQSRRVSLGHGEVPGLEARCRAHANFNEYVPMALILMGLIEMNVGASRWLWAVGALLVVARVLHPFGLDRPVPNPYRMLGASLTLVSMLLLIGWAIAIAYGVKI
jgi:uncharacterized membrane protein YecN with MAPEG domain